jgi:hypothetical protein
MYYLMGQETSGLITPLIGRLIDLSGSSLIFTALSGGLCIVSAVALVVWKRI